MHTPLEHTCSRGHRQAAAAGWANYCTGRRGQLLQGHKWCHACCWGKLLCISWLAGASVYRVSWCLVLATSDQKHKGMTSCMQPHSSTSDVLELLL
jgi:hypothetical protein